MIPEEQPMSVSLNPLTSHKRVVTCTAAHTLGFTRYSLKCCDMSCSHPPSDSKLFCFPKDPPRNLHFQQKLFPHKNQLKWCLQKCQPQWLPGKNQQKWHPPSHPKDQTTVTLIWLLMLSLLSVGKHCSSKAGKCFISSNIFLWDPQRQSINFSSRNLSSLGYKGKYFFL